MSGWFQFQSLHCETSFRMTLKGACVISLIIWNSQMCREWRRWPNEAPPVSPCCSQSELHFRIVVLSLRTLVKLGFSVGSSLFAWTSSHQRSVLLTEQRLDGERLMCLSYFGSALLVEAADRCCVLTSLPLNSCLFLCNYSHWWAPPPCGVTLCLMAAISDQAPFVSPWNCSFLLECLCVVVVFFLSFFFGNIPAPFYFKRLNLWILFGAYIYGVVPLRFKHTFTLCTLSAAEESRRCALPELH